MIDNFKEYKDFTQDEINKELHEACSNGDLGLVKYFLTSPDLIYHSHVHSNNDYSFRLACFNRKMNVLRYLILELNIEKTKDIKDHLKLYPNKQVEAWFKSRDLSNKLKSELSTKSFVAEKRVKL